MLNTVALMGRLTRDPELRQTPTGKSVVSFTLACNRDFGTNGQEKVVDFFDISAWGKTADFVDKYFRKGQLVAVQGRLQTRKWIDKLENNRTSFEVVAERVHFAEKKTDPAAPAQANGTLDMTYEQPATYSEFTDLGDDDGELPF